MRRNPHRNAWRKNPGDTAYTCTAHTNGVPCGFKAKTAREQTSHADHFEVVVTRGPR